MAGGPELTKCLICGNSDFSSTLRGVADDRFGIVGVFDIARCMGCGTEQTFPRPTVDHLKGLYEAYYNFGGLRPTAYTRLREWFLQSPLYRLWAMVDGDISFHTVVGRGRLLDVGCNEGRSFACYAANGFAPEGLELNARAAALARERGFTVHEGLLERFQPTEPYDVVVLANVLEHVPDPHDMLKHAHRVLKPNGRLFVSCPNAESWQRHRFGRHWINWHVPFHLVHFAGPNLAKTLTNAGFSLTRLRHESPAVWTAQSVISLLFARPGRVSHQLRNPLLVVGLMALVRGLLFPVLWWGNRTRRGDCLVAVAEKHDPGAP